MGKKDARVDAYIARLPEFSKEICSRVRAIVHEASAEIEEDIKWGHPAFMHKGIVCGMAAFKAHVVIHFWKHALLSGSHARRATDDKTLERLGRVTSVDDLPPKSVGVAGRPRSYHPPLCPGSGLFAVPEDSAAPVPHPVHRSLLPRNAGYSPRSPPPQAVRALR